MSHVSTSPSVPGPDSVYDIIPDLHGEAAMLVAMLTRLGYVERGGAWRHPDASRRALFLGDFIDRGPENARVLDIVRRMTGEGTARAIMGNHEFNALLFHTPDPNTGAFLRPHEPSAVNQHEAFLAEFPVGAPETRDVLDWMARLPLFLDLDELRLVHACWDAEAIATLRRDVPPAGLTGDALLRCSRRGDPLREAVEIALKGPEVPLPDGLVIIDKDGHPRREARVNWWTRSFERWSDVAAWPEDATPPSGPVPPDVRASIAAMAYPADAPPVFFGHYWLKGDMRRQAPNALCLDYSVGRGGPLVSYRFTSADGPDLDLARVTCQSRGQAA